MLLSYERQRHADRITSMAISGGGNTSSLAYDNGDQLQSLTVSNGPTQVSKNTYGFDGRGNRTSVAIQGGATTASAYDQANHLTAYGSSATYTYNGDGLRMNKTVSGSAEAFTWDLAEGLPLILQDGSTSYVTGPGGLPLEQINGTTVYYYHADQLGSTRAMTDSAGVVQQSYEYDPYGNAATSTGTLTNPLRYSGQYFDTEAGLYYLRARSYDPSSRQFMSRDPMVSLTKAAYAYVADTPLNGTDPTGMDWWNGPAAAVVGGIGAFVGNAVDNLHSSNPALVALGVAESVVIAAPIAGVIFVAGGAVVAAGIEAVSGAMAATSEAAAVYGPLGGIYTARVLAQMSQDDYHGFPTLMDSMVNEGGATAGVGADGQAYTYVNLPGFINGCSGTYQWVINGAGEITHRFFAPGT